jgi:hypothetical protein
MAKLVIIRTLEESKNLWPKDHHTAAGFKYVRDGRTRRIKSREIWINKYWLTRFGFVLAFMHELGHLLTSFLPERVNDRLDVLYDKAWTPLCILFDDKMKLVYKDV